MGISFRGLGIGVVASVAVCLIVSYAELVVKYIQIGFLQLPPVVVGVFCFILLITAWFRRAKSRFALNPQELLTVYCMMLFAAMISSRGCLEKILPLLVTLPYFANDGNGWASLYFPHVRKWMVPFDPSQPDSNTPQLVAQRFFEGLRSGETIPWNQWIGPLACWGLLVFLIFGAFMCLASILRRQWVDNEKLSFPLAQLPLEMVSQERGASIWRSRLTWVGVAIPTIVFTANGLHGWFPSVPQVPLQFHTGQYFTSPPASYAGDIPINVSFAAIGFFFLLPVEMLFSLWFFFLFGRFQQVIAGAYGLDMPKMPMYPPPLFVGYQQMGAFFVLAAYLVYVSRSHLKQVLAAALRREKMDDSGELLPYRTAVFGLVFCMLGAALWLAFAGMSPMLALLELVIFIFVVAIVMARSTAEGGLLMTETTFRPVDVYRLFAPTHTLGPGAMTVSAFMDSAFFRDLRGLVLTGFLDGLKIADGAKVRRRAFLPVFVLAIVLAMLVGGAFQIWLPYRLGGAHLYWYSYSGNNQWGLMDYQAAMNGTVPRLSWQGPTFFAVGAAFTGLLAYMRYAYVWWPFHPLGYALCGSWTMIVFWFPCFTAWLIKVNLMKYGGMRGYLQARPLFLGLVVGEFSIAVAWTVLAWAVGTAVPGFPWM